MLACHWLMRLAIKSDFGTLKWWVELFVRAMKFFRMVLSIYLVHTLTFEESFEGTPRLRPLECSILRVEARFRPCFIFTILCFPLSSPFSIIFNLVPILFECIKIWVLVFATLSLLPHPFCILSLVEVFHSFCTLGFVTPFLVMIRCFKAPIIPVPWFSVKRSTIKRIVTWMLIKILLISWIWSSFLTTICLLIFFVSPIETTLIIIFSLLFFILSLFFLIEIRVKAIEVFLFIEASVKIVILLVAPTTFLLLIRMFLLRLIIIVPVGVRTFRLRGFHFEPIILLF